LDVVVVQVVIDGFWWRGCIAGILEESQELGPCQVSILRLVILREYAANSIVADFDIVSCASADKVDASFFCHHA